MENQLQHPNEKLQDGAGEQPLQGIRINPANEEMNLHIEKLKLEQNLPLGFIGGAAACIVGAILWAVITVLTNYQIGYMAVAVGLLVGYAIRYFGKGIDQIFGIFGSALSLAGCLLGNFLSIVGFAAKAEGMNYFEVLPLIDLSLVPQIMIDSFSPMDLLFYGLAIYEGYKFSFRDIPGKEAPAHTAG
jgi:hypothetical protein